MSAAPCQVLLVEDNALVSDALTILLESGGHAVRVADTVAAAVRQARETQPDVLLLDLTLPDGDGLSVLDALRDTPSFPRITAALTGHDDRAVRTRCLAAGCRDVLVKPVPARELLAKVAEWAGNWGARARGREGAKFLLSPSRPRALAPSRPRASLRSDSATPPRHACSTTRGS